MEQTLPATEIILVSEHDRIVDMLNAVHRQQIETLRAQHRKQLEFLARQVAQEQDAFLDPVNRHAVRQKLGVDDMYLYQHPQVLLDHYIESGGAEAFAVAYRCGLVKQHIRRRKRRKKKRREPEYYI